MRASDVNGIVSETPMAKARVITSECLSIEQVSREEECRPWNV
jgi:hypothetical protein